MYRPFNAIPQNSCFRHVCKINNMCTKLFEWEGGSKGLQGNELTAHIFSYERKMLLLLKKHFVSLPANIFRICLLRLHLFITHSMRYGLKVRRKVVVIHKICHAGYYINEWW